MKRLDLSLPRAWDSAAAALAACARLLGDARSPSTIAAASGLAFRLGIDRRVTPAGPLAGPWREELTVAAERLGCRWNLVASTAREPLFAHAVDDAFALAVAGVDAGRPTILFGVQLAEFGLAVGHDGDALVVSGMLDAAGAPDRLPRGRLGEVAGRLFALQLVERLAIDDALAARATLAAAVDDWPAAAQSWHAWHGALESGDLDPLGLAACAQRYAEARAAVAVWLLEAARATGLDLSAVEKSVRRAAGMLAELAHLVPYPPGPGFMLTSTLREEAAALVGEAARAEDESRAALGRILDEAARSSAAAGLELRPLDARTLPDLFACVREIPIAGLDGEARDCRAALAPVLGHAVDGRVLYHGATPVGHVLWGPLADAHVPVLADGDRWFLYCPWLESARRGQGVGARLFAAAVEAARAAGVDGIFTLATALDVFLHHHAFEKHGFVEVDRHGDTRLLELKLGDAPSRARLVPDRPPPPRPGALPVVVRHSYGCPLLLRVRRDAARVAGALGPAITVDERDAAEGEPAGVLVAGRALPHAPVPAEVLEAALRQEIAHSS